MYMYIQYNNLADVFCRPFESSSEGMVCPAVEQDLLQDRDKEDIKYVHICTHNPELNT